MIVLPAGVKVHLALGHTDMRKGLDGLAALIQEYLKKDPFICGGADYVAAVALEPLDSMMSADSPPHNV
jgi:IS66 Orf2 like protein